MAIANYLYQSKPTMIQVANTLILGIATSNPIFKYFYPIKDRNSVRLQWTIEDNNKGLMALRGAGGKPTRVNPNGLQAFDTTPGVFGEYTEIDEIQLLELGVGVPAGSGITIDVRGEIARRQALLLVREKNRMRQMAWTMARTGQLGVPLPGGGIGYREAVTRQTFTVDLLWTNKATAHPLANFMSLQQQYGIGTSNNFGMQAFSLMNTYTAQLLFTNTNPNDWGGKRTLGGGTVQGMGYYDIIRADLMLPQIIIWDDGYLDENGAFQLDCPNGEVLIGAARPDSELPGEFSLTYNAISGAPGAYSLVKDFTNENEDGAIPPRLEVHAGFNGGLVESRPSQIVRMIVA